MGEDVQPQEFTRADRTRHREKVRRNLDVFACMLREAHFDTDDPMTGLEVELNLVDDEGDPALRNAEALDAISDAAFQTSSDSSTSRSTCRRRGSGSTGCARSKRVCAAASTTRRRGRRRSVRTS